MKLPHMFAVVLVWSCVVLFGAVTSVSANRGPVRPLATTAQVTWVTYRDVVDTTAVEVDGLTETLNQQLPDGVPDWVVEPLREDMRRRLSMLTINRRRAERNVAIALNDLARSVAPEGVDAERLTELWQELPQDRLLVVLAALSRHGAGYRFTAAGPHTYDCSGFTLRVFEEIGVTLPHKAAYQFSDFPKVERDVAAGDLVFFAGGPTAAGPFDIGHVGVYLGEGVMVHANSAANSVSVDPLIDSYVGAVNPFTG